MGVISVNRVTPVHVVTMVQWVLEVIRADVVCLVWPVRKVNPVTMALMVLMVSTVPQVSWVPRANLALRVSVAQWVTLDPGVNPGNLVFKVTQVQLASRVTKAPLAIWTLKLLNGL